MSYYDNGFVGNNELMQAALMKQADNPRMLTVAEQTRLEIAQLEDRLLRKRELLTLLESNPEINRIFDLMR